MKRAVPAKALLRPVLVLTVMVTGLTGLTGCDVYDRPRRPLPQDFQVTTLQGEVLTPESMRGTPWVINIWVPG